MPYDPGASRWTAPAALLSLVLVCCALRLCTRRKQYDAKGKLVDRPAPAAKPAADQAASMSTS